MTQCGGVQAPNAFLQFRETNQGHSTIGFQLFLPHAVVIVDPPQRDSLEKPVVEVQVVPEMGPDRWNVHGGSSAVEIVPNSVDEFFPLVELLKDGLDQGVEQWSVLN